MKVPAGRINGGRVVGAWPGATGRGDPTVAKGWNKKLLAGLVDGLGVVAGNAGKVGVGGREGVVGELGAGEEGEGDAGRCETMVAGLGKLRGWNAFALPVGVGRRVVNAVAPPIGVGRRVVGDGDGRGVGEKAGAVV